ncbi:MAG: hypothetical protein QGG53_35300 [Planctomycetota bacterium]|jgi:hypothetical protein|nr:hypothetical protein [Planctomycetota bacterium]
MSSAPLKQKWLADWSSGEHQGSFRFDCRSGEDGLLLEGNLLEWSGPQPAFITGDEYFQSRLDIRFVNQESGVTHEKGLATHPIQLALGVRYGGYLMVDEDIWVPPQRGFSAGLTLSPGTYDVELAFTLFDASHLRPLLTEMLHGFRGADPFGEVRIMEYQESNLEQGDGSYLGFPWHSEETLPDDPYHLGYRVAFTLYAIEAMAAASRFLGQDWSRQISDSVGWLYENFGTAVESGGPPLKRILSPALRSLLLMPLQGFVFRPASGGAVRVNSLEASSPF